MPHSQSRISLQKCINLFIFINSFVVFRIVLDLLSLLARLKHMPAHLGTHTQHACKPQDQVPAPPCCTIQEIYFLHNKKILFCLSIPEYWRIQHEHPHAWPPCEFFWSDDCSDAERRGTVGVTNLSTWRYLPAYGHTGESMAPHSHRS